MVATFSALIESGVISTLMVATCGLTAYFLIDTYLLREPSPKYTKDGTAFILRLKEPLDTGLAIKAGGTRLIQTIAVVKQQSDDLKTEIAGRLTKDQTYRTDLAAFMTQLEDAGRMIAASSSPSSLSPRAVWRWIGLV